MKFTSFVLLLPLVLLVSENFWTKVEAQTVIESSAGKKRVSDCAENCLAGRCYFKNCQGKSTYPPVSLSFL